MKFLKVLTLSVFCLAMISCEDIPTDAEKKVAIETILEEYNECKETAESHKDCKSFVARAICEYNGLDDLKKDGEYIEYNEIYDFISAGDSWKSLGFAPEQKVMTEAQELANEGFAVIAVNTEDKHKFTVIIVKGELTKSTKWSSEVPSCAAFFPASSKMESFINKTINYAWSKPDGVEFFVKR